MMQTPRAPNESLLPPLWLRWLGVAGLLGAIAACNAVLGIEEAELRCSAARCSDPEGILTEDESLEDDGSLAGPLPVRGPASGRELDGGVDAAGETVLPGSPGSELGPNVVMPPNTGGTGGTANGGGDDDDDDDEEEDDDDNSGSSSGSGQNPNGGGGSGNNGTGSGSEGPASPACAPNEARCRASRLERCNADRTGFETIECGSPSLCNEAAARCDACEPNAARCQDRSTAAICDSTGTAETFIPCDALSGCIAGRCELLGIGL